MTDQAQGEAVEVSKVKQRLSAHVQYRMASTDTNCEHHDEKMMLSSENIKLERDDGHDGVSQEGPSNAPSPVHTQQQQGQSASSGSFTAGSLVLSNSILDEVLNEKKLALLQSPDVIRFLREAQKKTG